MIRKVPTSKEGHVRVVFELPASIWADHIYLVGEFNHWNTEEIAFCQERDGVWRAAIDLPVGKRYEFRYLIDGAWTTDYQADGWTENSHGSQNSIVITTPPQAAQPLQDNKLSDSELPRSLKQFLARRAQRYMKPDQTVAQTSLPEEPYVLARASREAA